MERTAIAAGTFYPASTGQLKTLLSDLFRAVAKKASTLPLVSLIVPHAGYVYSGKVAATAIAQIDPNRSYQHIFLIGSSHTHLFHGAALYLQNDYATPLGKIPIDPLASQLLKAYSLFNDRPEIQAHEHALEVILPFLQFWLKQPFSIVPIIIGGESEDTPQQLAEILKPYFNEKNLFIISSDFSHYPAYHDALISDNAMAEAIASGLPERFLQTKKELENKRIPQLVTTACGWTAILTLLHLMKGDPKYTIARLFYQNSGDSIFGEKNRVVGYHAIAVYLNEQQPNI